MPRSELGRWGRLYASIEEDLAHYDDGQFRAAIEILCRAVRNRGELPKLRPLRARYAATDFLVEEGFLEVDGQTVTISKWSSYQAPPDPTNARRQSDFRARRGQPVDNGDNALLTDDQNVTVTPRSLSISESVDQRVDVDSAKPEEATYHPDSPDLDSQDTYHRLTLSRPWGRPAGGWLTSLEATHGLVAVNAALEVEYKLDGRTNTLLGRVETRLAKQADRVQAAKAREPKKVDPLIAEIGAAYAANRGSGESGVEPDPEAGQKLREAFERGDRPPWMTGGGSRGGAMAKVGELLPSGRSGSPETGPTLTGGEGSDREPPAAVDHPVGLKNGKDPSPLRTSRVRLNPAPNRASPSTADLPDGQGTEGATT